MTEETMQKLKKGLELCKTLENPGGVTALTCEVCPYNDEGESTCNSHVALFRDALEAVNELIPHPLTLEEADDADVCWMQIKGSERVAPCRVWMDGGKYGYSRIDRFCVSTDEFQFEPDYGKTWVCWSLRPSKEQRQGFRWAE